MSSCFSRKEIVISADNFSFFPPVLSLKDMRRNQSKNENKAWRPLCVQDLGEETKDTFSEYDLTDGLPAKACLRFLPWTFTCSVSSLVLPMPLTGGEGGGLYFP